MFNTFLDRNIAPQYWKMCHVFVESALVWSYKSSRVLPFPGPFNKQDEVEIFFRAFDGYILIVSNLCP